MGYSPVAPGTVGTIGAVFLLFALSMFSLEVYFFFLIGFIIFSIWVSGRASCLLGAEDPRQVVIDEVCGYMVTMSFLPLSLTNMVIGFFLFRFFDVVKPPPLRRLESLKGGVGIVADDICAGVYANFILQIITRVKGG
ncbi:Phosphatidylglycerophosphatase A [bacterium HR37]|nr:Phosphatidylglycerophosphatase A [bacterium HR37]